MQDWRAQYLGLATFPTNLAVAEIDEFFTLGDVIAQVGDHEEVGVGAIRPRILYPRRREKADCERRINR